MERILWAQNLSAHFILLRVFSPLQTILNKTLRKLEVLSLPLQQKEEEERRRRRKKQKENGYVLLISFFLGKIATLFRPILYVGTESEDGFEIYDFTVEKRWDMLSFPWFGFRKFEKKKKQTDVNVFIRCIHLCFGAMEKEAVRCYEVLVEG